LKRTAAILILGLLLFNLVGFRLFTAYMEGSANNNLEDQLDGNSYDESELISIKVPAIHLGYYTNSNQFERVDGQMEIGVIEYKYVKRRLFNDSLELMCIPNWVVMNLQTAKDEFFRLVNDLKHTGQSKRSDSHPGSSKIFSIDVYAVHELFKMSDLYFTSAKRSSHDCVKFSSFFSPTAEQPPEVC
jgi:hypothetical protein